MLARTLFAILILLTAACTPGADAPVDPGPSPTAVASAPPSIPRPAELPSAGPIDPVTARPEPPAAPGEVILIHLEGPTTDAAATDLVVRTDGGEEVDRFRVAGAVAVHAGQGGRHALVEIDGDRWARYDATTGGLSLLSFDGVAPSGVPTVVGPSAWWVDPAAPWLVRLDTGTTTSLADQVGEGATVTATIDGSHLLVDGEVDHVVDTAEGTSRSLPDQVAVTLAPDGSGLAGTTGAGEVVVEAVDGADRRVVGTVSGTGLPTLLPDGRVVVLGPDSALLGTDGTQVDLPPVVGVTACARGADHVRLLCATAAQLVVVDPVTVTVTTLPGTAGMGLAPQQPPGDVRWAVTADATVAGAVAVDMAAVSTTALLDDVPTAGFVAVAEDGDPALLRVGPAGTAVAVATPDGVTEVVSDVRGAALGPGGDRVALGLVRGGGRLLRVLDGQTVVDEIDTGRAPAWLRTTATDDPSTEG